MAPTSPDPATARSAAARMGEAVACPYLGLPSDLSTRFSFADRAHACHAANRARPVDLAYQGSHCLSARNTDLNERYRRIRGHVAAATGDERIAALEPIYEPFRVGDVRLSLADPSRARAAFGFEPSTALADGLARDVDWFFERSRAGRRG